jgi:hypothetical protein
MIGSSAWAFRAGLCLECMVLRPGSGCSHLAEDPGRRPFTLHHAMGRAHIRRKEPTSVSSTAPGGGDYCPLGVTSIWVTNARGYPAALGWISTPPIRAPVIVNLPDVAPGGIATREGLNVTNPGLFPES